MKKNGEKIRYDIWRFSVSEWVKYAAAGLGTGLFLVWICYHSVWALPLAVPVLILFLRSRQRTLIRQRSLCLNDHFREFLSALHISMRSGYALENAVRNACGDLELLYGQKDCLVLELQSIGRQLRYGVPAEELFGELGERSGQEDLRLFGELLAVAKRTGGDMGKVLEDCRQTLCGKIETAKEIETAAAAKRFEQNLMSLMPAAVILYLRFSFSGFVEKLYGNAIGVLVMSFCLALYLFAFFLGRRLVRIEV